MVLVSCPRAYTAGARRRRQRRAGRRQERGRSQSRKARPAERSAAGCLDEVEKPVTALGGRNRRLGTSAGAWCGGLPTEGVGICTARGLGGQSAGRCGPEEARRTGAQPSEEAVPRWSPDREIRNWALGLAGERSTGRRLNTLRRQGWRVLHSVQWPSGSDIDHLVIGPSGVFTINSKCHRGKTVWYGDHAITVNRAPTRYIVVSEHEARRTSRALSDHCGFLVPVRPVIAIVGAARLSVKNAAPPVLVIDGATVHTVLSGLAPVLPPERVERTFSVARRGETWAGR
ncbi:nuclease-related domain-containing protein [Streptomyces sp. NPDC052299]|uniref:nuclease-related domain-containing protein n=1 Tax=Streptomyces sp. NPDC052299 TaxID=3155054 RepID=UPI003422BB67